MAWRRPAAAGRRRARAVRGPRKFFGEAGLPGHMLAICWPYVGHMLAICWPYGDGLKLARAHAPPPMPSARTSHLPTT